MSLLMDALKQAEEANDEKDQQPDDAASDSFASGNTDDPQAESGLGLELPEPEPIEEYIEIQETGTDVEDHWITDPLSPNESVDTRSADSGLAEEITIVEEPQTATEVAAVPVENDAVTEEETLDESSESPEQQEPATTTRVTPPDAAAHVLSASRAYNRRRRTFLILTFTGLLCGVACVIAAYWYWAQSRNAPQQPVPFTSSIEPEAVINHTGEVVTSASANTEDTVTTTDISGNGPVEQNWQPAPVDPRALQVRVDSPHTNVESSTSGETTLRFSRTRDRNSVQPALKSAYAAFRKNQYHKARDLYQDALQREPRNRDALLGLAAVAVKNDDFDVAAGYYHRLLELNPRDSAAHAGLTMLLGSRDPVAAESQIKLLLNSNADAAYLYFALGNVYSEQARWPEAQEAYFDAVRLDGENPDYAYNLAISLDRLSKHSAALRYYQTALSLGSMRTANFSTGVIRERIRLLEAMDTRGAPGAP